MKLRGEVYRSIHAARRTLDKTMSSLVRTEGRCERSRRQSATVCGNLEQSEQFATYWTIIPHWLHLGQVVAGSGRVERVKRQSLRISPFWTCSLFRLQAFCQRQSRVGANAIHTVRRDATRRSCRVETGVVNWTYAITQTACPESCVHLKLFAYLRNWDM